MGLTVSRWISTSLINEILKDLSAMGGSVVMAIFILGLAFFRGRLSVQLFMGMTIVMIVGYLIKALIRTQRPDHHQRNVSNAAFDQLDSSSFPSIHAARISMAAAILMPLGSRPFQFFLVLLALAVMSSRVHLRRHHVRDVIGGAVIGALIGWLVLQF